MQRRGFLKFLGIAPAAPLAAKAIANAVSDPTPESQQPVYYGPPEPMYQYASMGFCFSAVDLPVMKLNQR